MKYRKTQISELGRKCITHLDFPIQNLTLNEHDCGVKRKKCQNTTTINNKHTNAINET